jgi:hypothetical protein
MAHMQLVVFHIKNSGGKVSLHQNVSLGTAGSIAAAGLFLALDWNNATKSHEGCFGSADPNPLCQLVLASYIFWCHDG